MAFEASDFSCVKKLKKGNVYEALYKDKFVAIKTIEVDNKSVVLDSQFSKLKHENIALFLGTMRANNNYSLVVEFYQNGSLLDTIVDKIVSFPAHARWKLAIGIANGLNYLHKEGFIHGNLKSSNVLIGNYWTPKLTDFLRNQNLNASQVEYQKDFVDFGIILWEISNRRIFKSSLRSSKEEFPAPITHLLQKCIEAPESISSISDVLDELVLNAPKRETAPGQEDFEEGQILLERGRYSDSLVFFARSATMEYPPSFVRMYISSEEVTKKNYWKKKVASVIDWYHKAAANSNDPSALCNLGLCYHLGMGVQKDFTKAFELYLRASKFNYAPAWNNLGYSYDNGTGVKKDYTQAVRNYLVAAELRYAAAQSNLASCYDNGSGTEQDFTQSVRWYKKAVKQGYARAQNNLAYAYEKGYGVDVDQIKAAELYRKAALQEYPCAQVNLGYCYDDGLGVAKDPVQAMYWYRLAAKQGDSRAQSNIGACYEEGRGVIKDCAEAVEWYKMAAEQSNVIAMVNLASCYEDGRGVPKNIFSAQTYYGLAAKHGSAYAKSKAALLKYQV